jgi:hypothetical protein
MAQKPPGKTSGDGRVTFTKSSAERIADVVRKVEAGDRDGDPFGNSPRLSSAPYRLKLGTFTGAWATGTYKTVTLKDSTQTVSVYNWCNPAGGNTSTAQYVIFGKVHGTASVVEIPTTATSSTAISTTCMSIGSFNFATLPNYDASQIQILGHDLGPSVCLRWYSIATCSTT